MKHFQWILIFSFLFLGCQSSEKSFTTEHNKQVRHGWVIFSGPRPTKDDEKSSEVLARGEALYKKHCIQCHGVNGEGDGPRAEILNIKPANLTALTKDEPNHYLLFQINQGRSNMPSWKDVLSLKQRDRKSVV